MSRGGATWVSWRIGYGELRLAATQSGYDGLFAPEPAKHLRFPREMKVDQYGIRPFPFLKASAPAAGSPLWITDAPFFASILKPFSSRFPSPS